MSAICIDCGTSYRKTGGNSKRCKPCSADDYDRRHARVGTARQHIVALLNNVTECSLQDMVKTLPKSEHAIEYALHGMVIDGTLRRTQWGVYALALEKPKAAVPQPPRAQFITPIPKHRLMAGRA